MKLFVLRRFLAVFAVCSCLPALAIDPQSNQADQVSKYLRSLSPDEVRQYRELAGDTTPLFDPPDARVIANVQGFLGVLGYGKLSSGEVDAKTQSELKAFQKHAQIPETGMIDLLTYFALSREFNHPPTYAQIKASNSLPKWATAVCFQEKTTDSSMTLVENPENYSDETASDFVVYGAKGDLGIQTEEYVHGKSLAYAKWETPEGFEWC